MDCTRWIDDHEPDRRTTEFESKPSTKWTAKIRKQKEGGNGRIIPLSKFIIYAHFIGRPTGLPLPNQIPLTLHKKSKIPVEKVWLRKIYIWITTKLSCQSQHHARAKTVRQRVHLFRRRLFPFSRVLISSGVIYNPNLRKNAARIGGRR
jgi:hypothetical protein